jgi:hypothetical protein
VSTAHAPPPLVGQLVRRRAGLELRRLQLHRRVLRVPPCEYSEYPLRVLTVPPVSAQSTHSTQSTPCEYSEYPTLVRRRAGLELRGLLLHRRELTALTVLRVLTVLKALMPIEMVRMRSQYSQGTHGGTPEGTRGNHMKVRVLTGALTGYSHAAPAICPWRAVGQA